MADDRRQQLADDVAAVIDQHRATYGGPESIACTAGCIAEWEPVHVADALLPLFDRVAADAAAGAEGRLAAVLDVVDVMAVHVKHGAGSDLFGTYVRELRRAAAHRTPTPSSEENARG